MKKHLTILAAFLITAAVLVSLAGCPDGSEKGGNNEEKDFPDDWVASYISIDSQPAKTSYYAGQSFSSAGMKVIATFENGEMHYVTKYTVTPSGALNAGTNFVTITYRGKTARVDITVTVDPAFSNKYFSNDFDTSLCSFYDKFNGTSLDKTKWGYQNGNGNWGWGNGELQNYQGDTNAKVQNGILSLILEKRSVGGQNYASAKLVTATGDGNTPSKPFSQTYGRFEAKIKLSKAAAGLWPAFWMMPVSATYGGWPRSGEIDIMEMKGSDTTHASSTIHVMPDWQANSFYGGAEYKYENNSTFTDWHVYGVEWKEGEMTFLIDGKQHVVLRKNPWNTTWYQKANHNANAPFDKPFFLILNLAVGGWFDGNKTPKDAELPISLDIDWVRVYTLEKNPWPIVGSVPNNLVTTYWK